MDKSRQRPEVGLLVTNYVVILCVCFNDYDHYGNDHHLQRKASGKVRLGRNSRPPGRKAADLFLNYVFIIIIHNS